MNHHSSISAYYALGKERGSDCMWLEDQTGLFVLVLILFFICSDCSNRSTSSSHEVYKLTY